MKTNNKEIGLSMLAFPLFIVLGLILATFADTLPRPYWDIVGWLSPLVFIAGLWITLRY